MRLVDDLHVLAARLDLELETAEWTAWRRHSEILIPSEPVALVDLAEALLLDSGNDIDEAYEVVDAWLSRPAAVIEVEVFWEGCCTSSSTTVRRVHDYTGRFVYFVLCPDEDVGGPEVFARVASPASVLSRFRVLKALFRSSGQAFGVEPGPFRTGTVSVTEPSLAAFSEQLFRD